jgi:hypothetical protein
MKVRLGGSWCSARIGLSPNAGLSRFAPLLDGLEFWFLDGDRLDRLA